MQMLGDYFCVGVASDRLVFAHSTDGQSAGGGVGGERSKGYPAMDCSFWPDRFLAKWTSE